jgi:uracil-DNA glycosylase
MNTELSHNMSKNNIMLVGEAWGEKEEETGVPFSGTSGWLLDQMLSAAGIARRDCYVTNVFNLRPKPSADVKNLCGSKAEGIPGLPQLDKGKYILARYAGELERLYDEVRREEPNVIVTLGATATWAFCHTSGIKQYRGAVTSACHAVNIKLGREQKVLPTYHPAMVARDYTARPIVIADLSKAAREAATPVIQRPERYIWLYPTIEDLEQFEREHIIGSTLLSIDIETAGDQITCIGFAPNPSVAIVVPLFLGINQNYWGTRNEELVALNYVRRWCAMIPSVFQNGLYDIKYLWQRYGIPVPLAAEDTMLLHHAWQPEMEKGLGFLATLYTDEASWKFMRKGKKHD